jgi:hypothetical protein
MNDLTTENKPDEFKQQTPEVYRWAMGAGGLVAAGTTAVLAYKPDTAGYALSGLILFILLIFVVISLERGTAKFDESNPLTKNARWQVQVLSWFSTMALIVAATAIISSIFTGYPLELSLNEDRTSNRYLASIKRYDLGQWSFFERDGQNWSEKAQRDNKIIFHTFMEEYLNSQFLLLSDNVRNVKIRIPTQGGMVQWSLNEKFNNCDDEYCWGDVGQAIMRR